MNEILQNKKITKIIYSKLTSDLKDMVIIGEGPEVWIVNPETHEWYFLFDNMSSLYYNKIFFNNFFSLFTLKSYAPILKTWFENLGFGTVKGVSTKGSIHYTMVVKTLKNKKPWSLTNRYGFSYNIIKKMISQKNKLKKQNIQIKDFITDDMGFYKILY